MDLLAGHLPAFVRLSPKERETFIAHARVSQAPEGTTILRHDEVGDEVYFVLLGQTAAGLATEEGEYRSLSNMNPGDFFGEIAALTGSPRTADVVAVEQTTLLQVPAETLRQLMKDPQLSHLFLTTMTERLARTHISDLPRFAAVDQESLRALRTPKASPEMEPSTENTVS
jgi:CRP-like cAMP-binding protein